MKNSALKICLLAAIVVVALTVSHAQDRRAHRHHSRSYTTTHIKVSPRTVVHPIVSIEANLSHPHCRSAKKVSHTHVCYNTVIGSREFDALYKEVRHLRFDAEKNNLILYSLSKNNFFSYQIRDLIDLLKFEDSKVYIAKEAYAATVDKTNYYRITESFVFNSSKQEVDNYIYHYNNCNVHTHR